MAKLDRKTDNPWVLKTPPGTSEYTMHVDYKDGLQVLVCTVGNTVLLYNACCIDDLYAMLKEAGDWVELGGADEQKPAKEGTVEPCGDARRKIQDDHRRNLLVRLKEQFQAGRTIEQVCVQLAL